LKKRSCGGLMFALAIFSLAMVSCGVSSKNIDEKSSQKLAEAFEQKTKLRVAWWGSSERHERTLKAIELFEEKYPNIQVVPEFTGWDSYWEKLNTQAIGSNLPDVVQMDIGKLNEFRMKGYLVDLASYINAGMINLEDVDDIYQEVNVDGNNTWAVSLGANAFGVVYNKTLFDKAGIELAPGYTYEELYQELQKAKNVLEESFYGYSFANADYESFFVYVRQNGEQFYSEDSLRLGFKQETLTAYFEFVKKLIDDRLTPPPSVVLEHKDLANSLAARGEAALQMSTSNQIVGVASDTEDKIGLMLLPTLKDGEAGNWIRSSQSFSITKNAENLEAAAAFIDFMTNSLEANEILGAERGVPISSKVREHIYDMLDEPTREQFSFLETLAAFSKPADSLPPPGETEVRAAFMHVAEALKYGRVTPREAAKQFMSEAKHILSN
jgi:multiple sugar transport system substrate-binding protein